MSAARVYDMPLSSARRAREASSVSAVEATVFDDLADGALVVDCALACAGFDYEARQLVVSLIGLVGAGSELKVFDEELAEHLGCSARTVRRWRAAYLSAAESKRFGPLLVVEGEYDATKQRYEPTAYSAAPEVAEFVNLAVAVARASEEYGRNRRAALERAASEHYDDIPDAPPRRRHSKPRRAPTLRIERDFENARRNVERGRQVLLNLPPRTRTAFLTGRQGAELRQLLEELKGQIDEVLEVFPQDVEPAEDSYIPDILSGTPLGEEVAPEAETRVRDKDIDNTRTPSAEDEAAWESLSARLRTSRVETVDVDLRPAAPPPSANDPPVGKTIEELEAEAIQIEYYGGSP